MSAGRVDRISRVAPDGLEAQPPLKGDALAAGFYLIELILRMVGEGEAAPRLFAGFWWALEQLAGADDRLAEPQRQHRNQVH